MRKPILICVIVALVLGGGIYSYLSWRTAYYRAQNGQHFLTELQTINSQLSLYKMQHSDTYPDFKSHGWTQLVFRTNSRGEPATREGAVGPYLKSHPKNPFTNSSEILVVDRLSPDSTTGGKYGFVFDQSAGHMFGLTADGKVLTESTAFADAR